MHCAKSNVTCQYGREGCEMQKPVLLDEKNEISVQKSTISRKSINSLRKLN
jgi:hypothetical protein